MAQVLSSKTLKHLYFNICRPIALIKFKFKSLVNHNVKLDFKDILNIGGASEILKHQGILPSIIQEIFHQLNSNSA